MTKHITIELTHVERGKVQVYLSDNDGFMKPCWVDDNSDGERSYCEDDFEETEMQIWKKWRAAKKAAEKSK